MNQGARLLISGRVQGVSYRYWTQREAQQLGLTGFVRNRSDGAVEAEVLGDGAAVAAMAEACREGPTFARVSDVSVVEIDYREEAEFQILPTV